MRAALAAVAFLASLPVTAWRPPENPDPHEVLREAREDRVAARYEESLQKHLWFHAQALRIDPALAGVRLSFALSDWAHLASKYPPAMAQLRRVRDEAVADVRAGRNASRAFHDLVAINRELDDAAGTTQAFREIEARDPPLARVLYGAAQEALITTREFALCARYMDAGLQATMIVDTYRRIMRSAPHDIRPAAERYLAANAGRIVAALVLGGRPADASRAAATFRDASDSTEVHAVIDRALEGEVPAPAMSAADRDAYRKSAP